MKLNPQGLLNVKDSICMALTVGGTHCDHALAKGFIKLRAEKNALLICLFHALFRDEKEIAQGFVNTHQKLTVSHLRECIEYFLENGYLFVSPDDILRGLKTDKKYVLLTFDDGYYNNRHAAPLLEEYKIPALFFISTNNVQNKKSFWWDSTYREARKRNATSRQIDKEERFLKTKTSEEIDRYIISKYGAKPLSPVCDIDRPFTPSELKEFAKSTYVFLGNHTSDHAILTNYSEAETRRQIAECQEYLFKLTGKVPIAISYPNGNYSKKIVKIAGELGLKLGLTVEPRKNYLPIPLAAHKCVNLGRFIVKGGKGLVKQLEIARSDFSVTNKLRHLFRIKY